MILAFFVALACTIFIKSEQVCFSIVHFFFFHKRDTKNEENQSFGGRTTLLSFGTSNPAVRLSTVKWQHFLHLFLIPPRIQVPYPA